MLKKILFIIILLSSKACFSQQSTAYIYDKANRITQIKYDSCTSKIYTYDANGNRMSVRKVTIKTNDSLWHESCPFAKDGRIKLTSINPTSNYTYTWNTGFVGNDIKNLAPGTYTVTVRDVALNISCIRSYIILPQFVDSFAIANIVNNTCYGYKNGKVKIRVVIADPRVTGIYNYSYQLDGTGLFTTIDSFVNLLAGSHYVNIKNGFTNCIKKLTFSITELPSNIYLITTSNTSCNDASDGKAEVIVNGNINNYTFQWKNLTRGITLSENTSKANNLEKGQYTITVKEKSGQQCEETKAFSIDGLSNGEKVVYPNPTTGEFKLKLCQTGNNKVLVYITNSLLQSLEVKEVTVVSGLNTLLIDLKKYPKGVYFIKVVLFDNNEIFRIIKE